MKTLSLFLFSLFAGGAFSSTEAEHVHTLRCRHFSGFPIGATTSVQRYAPDRLVDVEHLSLDVTPDFKNRRVAGTATLMFRPIVTPLEELRLDAVDLRISKVTSGDKIAAWENTNQALHQDLEDLKKRLDAVIESEIPFPDSAEKNK